MPTPSSSRQSLSKMQRGMWLHDELNPGSSTYNNAAALRLRGTLDRPALEKTLRFLHERHELLRARFEEDDDGVPLLVVTDRALAIDFVDLSQLPSAEREAAARKVATDASLVPFDLAEGPAWRALLVRLGETDHVLGLTVHHIVSDGWSLGIITADLASAYLQLVRWGSISLAAPEASFSAHVAAEEALEKSPQQAELEAFWARRLAGAQPRIALRYDEDPSAPAPKSRGASTLVRTAPDDVTALNAFCKRAHVTPFAGLLASFSIMLHARSGQTDMVVTTPFAGRDEPELAGVVGCFVNTVALRLDLSGNPTYRDLAQRAHRVVMEAVEHGRLPFADLIRTVSKGQESRDRQISNAVFVQNNAPIDVDRLGDLEVERFGLERNDVRYDMMMLCGPTRNGFEADFEYAAHRFASGTIDGLLAGWQRALAAAVRDERLTLADLTRLISGA